MPDLLLKYTTKTRTDNGLHKELLKKFRNSFNISSSTRFYNMDDEYPRRLRFDIENPNKGRGEIIYKNCAGEIDAWFQYCDW